MSKKIDLNLLEKIIKDTIKHLEEGKEQIAEIADTARQEKKELENNLLRIKRETLEVIDQVDHLEKEEKKARLHLMKVSREFERYSEEDVKEAYNQAREIQLQLGLLREREAQLRARRDQMELSQRRLQDAVEKAENLASKVGIAVSFLVSNLIGVGSKIEEIQQKQLLGLRIIRAQEEERKRVAREIHDGPAQSMANVVLRVEICEKLLERSPGDVKKELAGLKELVKDSLHDVRKIIFDLRPMVLDDLGIIPALKRYVSEFKKQSDLIIDFQTMGNKQDRLAGTLEVAIFRIIQEALNNVLKHSGARTVTIRLEQTETQVNIRIKDDGCGFDLEKVLRDQKSENFGLLGIRERTELLEGDCRISTAPGQGTDIIVKIPIKETESEVQQDETN